MRTDVSEGHPVLLNFPISSVLYQSGSPVLSAISAHFRGSLHPFSITALTNTMDLMVMRGTFLKTLRTTQFLCPVVLEVRVWPGLPGLKVLPGLRPFLRPLGWPFLGRLELLGSSALLGWWEASNEHVPNSSACNDPAIAPHTPDNPSQSQLTSSPNCPVPWA